MTRQTVAPQVGDLIKIAKRGNTTLLEVDYVDDLMVMGRVPYASTYTEGGQYQGSYRGRSTAWLDEVVEVVSR